MKRSIFVILILVCATIVNAQGRRFIGLTKGPATFVVAAWNASSHIRESAKYRCDGINDEIEIQAALDEVTITSGVIGSGVLLSGGQFNIEATIELRPGMSLRGQGTNITCLHLANNVDDSMFEFDGITGGGWIYIEDMLIYGNKVNNASTSHGIHFKTQCKDFYLSDVFISDFNDDGMHMHGTWGHVYNSIVVEFCGGNGIRLAGKNEYTMQNGTLAVANVALGETYTQSTSGATGRALASAAINDVTILITSDDDSNILDNTNLITFSGGGTYTPGGGANDRSKSSSSGPKVSNCKIMDNDNGQIYITRNINGMILNSEFKTSNGEHAIKMNGTYSQLIHGCQFTQIQDNNTGSYIAFVYTAWEPDVITDYDLGSNRNMIRDNYFHMTLTGSIAVTSDNNNNAANLVEGNVCYLEHSPSTLFDETSSQRRTKLHNNYIIPAYSVGSTSLQEITFDRQMFDMPDGDYRFQYHYAEGQWYSNALYTGTHLVDLPIAGSVGMEYSFLLEAAQQLQINPDNGDTIYLNDGDGTYTATSAAGDYVWADAIGEYIILRCLAINTWYAIEQGGIWTEE